MGLGKEMVISPIKILLRVIVSVILIALQIFIYYLLFVGSFNLPYIYLIASIISIILVIHLYNSKDNVSYKIVWIIIILTLNVTGPLLYLCFGNGNNLPMRKNIRDTTLMTRSCGSSLFLNVQCPTIRIITHSVNDIPNS